MRAKLLIAAALLPFGAAVGAPAPAFNVDSLFVASIGGPAALDSLKRITAVRSVGEVNLNGLPGRFEQFYLAPDRFYIRVNFGDFNLVQAYDGTTAWKRDQNGQVSTLSGFERRELLSSVYFESFSYLLPGRLDGSDEYLGTVTENGRCLHKVAFYPLNADTILVYFECETGLRTMMRSRLDNIDAETMAGDYRWVAGILLPYHAKTIAAEAGLFVEFQSDTVDLHARVDSNIFAMPSGGAADFRFPPGRSFVEIKFRYHAGHVLVPGLINGRKGVFILDSGASANMFDKSFADELRLPIVGTLPARGMGGFERVELVKTDSISIGELTLFNQVAGSLDLSLLGRGGEGDTMFGGLLGYDFLSRLPVMVNFKDSLLTVFSPDSFLPLPGGHEMPIHLVMLVPAVTGELDGFSGEFIIDLGNALGLIIHRGFAEANRLQQVLHNVQDNAGLFGGIGGSLPGKTAFASTFRMGDIALDSLRVILPDASEGMAGSEEIAGNIGNLILEHFAVLFDYPRSRVIFYDADK
ncbi:MAG TPA: retropepsin-like aspartic protease [Candidatus Deferrimicrobium sp.]|nr:retropepsin-like aspartic protease [Candidatus Deferrimicrobium sp.]